MSSGQSLHSLDDSESSNKHEQDHELEHAHTPVLYDGEQPHNAAANQVYQEEAQEVGSAPVPRNGPSAEASNGLSRQPSLLERVQSRYSFFNQDLKRHRTHLLLKYLMIYALMGTLVLAIFSIYWGSMYKREDRLKNLEMLVVIEDDHAVNGVDPLVGDAVKQVLQSDRAKQLGNWHFYNSSQFGEVAAKHNNEHRIEEEINRQIHHQLYWGAVYVKPNATYNYYRAIEQGNGNYNVSNNTVVAIHETARDFMNEQSYIDPNLQKIAQYWQPQSSNITTSLINQMSNKSDVLDNQTALRVATTGIVLQINDLLPYTNPVLVAPSQVGLIYMIIVTFFSFNFFSDIHQAVARDFKLKKPHFLSYRILSSILSFFVLSFFYSMVSLAMQVDMTRAFGHAGYLVYWMTSFLTMWSVGAMNEIMGMLLIMLYPPLLGFWMLFWVIINISPTFTPLALSPKFFRYGYALPIHNSYEINKVIFFDAYKGQLGRNYGILVAWIVIETVAMVPVVILFGKTMGKRAMAAKQKQNEQEVKQRTDASINNP